MRRRAGVELEADGEKTCCRSRRDMVLNNMTCCSYSCCAPRNLVYTRACRSVNRQMQLVFCLYKQTR